MKTFNTKSKTNLMTAPLLISEQNVVFLKNNGTKELLKLCENGDIFVNGKLVENDKEVVDGLREFLKGQQTFNKMEKQTAVEWLIKKLTNRENGIFDGFPHLSVGEIYEQAKEIEKQERENSYSDGWNDCERWFAEKELDETFVGKDII